MEKVRRSMAQNAMRHHIRENDVDFRPLAFVQQDVDFLSRVNRGRIGPDRADRKTYFGRNRGSNRNRTQTDGDENPI